MSIIFVVKKSFNELSIKAPLLIIFNDKLDKIFKNGPSEIYGRLFSKYIIDRFRWCNDTAFMTLQNFEVIF